MRKIITGILAFFCLFTFCSCNTDERKQEEVRNWRQDFQVKCTHIEESKFDDPTDALNALIDGTYVHEEEQYAITNKTNYVAERVYAVFHVDIYGVEPFDFRRWIGTIKQGETITFAISETWIKIEAEQAGIEYPEDNVFFDYDDCLLIGIDYEMK